MQAGGEGSKHELPRAAWVSVVMKAHSQHSEKQQGVAQSVGTTGQDMHWYQERVTQSWHLVFTQKKLETVPSELPALAS